MPWINDEMCVGCGVCVEECPVGAISMPAEAATIIDGKCIRCGRCHDVCPEDAVRHDGEKVPEEIETNLRWVRELLRHYETHDEKKGLVERMKRYFGKERKVAEQTIHRLEDMGSELERNK